MVVNEEMADLVRKEKEQEEVKKRRLGQDFFKSEKGQKMGDLIEEAKRIVYVMDFS